MLCARWDNDYIACLDFLVFAVYSREAAAGCEEEDLVDEMDLREVLGRIHRWGKGRGYFIADFAIYRDFHGDDLAEEAGV
jgi:hypothetical protein